MLFEETRDDIRLEIRRDDNAENPRIENESLGKMICFHRRYSFGDKHEYATPDDFLHDLLTKHFDSEDQAEKYEAECVANKTAPETILHESNVILPVYLCDHSGQTISTVPFADSWDSGQIGWIYADKESVIQAFGAWNDETIKKAQTALAAEVKTYDDYLNGEAYTYIFYDDMTDEILDSGTWIGDFETLKKETISLLPPENSEEELEELSSRLAERLIAEYDAYLLEVKALPSDEIVNYAYQIAAKGELAYAGEVFALSKRGYLALLSSKNASDELYSEWMHMEVNQNDEILECAHYAAKNAFLYQNRIQKGGEVR